MTKSIFIFNSRADCMVDNLHAALPVAIELVSHRENEKVKSVVAF